MQLLKNRNFTLLWISYFISLLGDWALDIALPILVYQLTGSGTALGAMVALEALPGIVLAPLAGVFVDRWDRRRVLIGTNILLGMSVLLLFLVQSSAQLWIIFLVGFLNACLGTFLYPARMALIPTLVAETHLIQANSLMTLTLQGSRLLGPALGGVLIGLAGPTLAFTIDTASFFFAAFCIFTIHVPLTGNVPDQTEKSQRGAQSLYQDLLAGIHIILSTPVLWATLVVWSVLILAGGAVTAVMVVFVREALGGDEASLGYLLSSQGFGMVVGGMTMMSLGARIQPFPVITGSVFLSGVLFFVVANTSSIILAALALCAMGMLMAVSAISMRTIFQTLPPPETRGRVLASNEAVASLMVFLGGASAGLLVDWVGIRAVMNLAALLVLLAALIAFVLLRSKQTAALFPRQTPEVIKSS